MIAKHIFMFEQSCILVCDAKCHKAWGISNRPQIYVDDPEQKVYGYGFADGYPDGVDDGTIDQDNTVDLADGELGEAPADPGTAEGDQAKPRTPAERLNKWCARECERSIVVDDLDAPVDFELPDYSLRVYNMRQEDAP